MSWLLKDEPKKQKGEDLNQKPASPIASPFTGAAAAPAYTFPSAVPTPVIPEEQHGSLYEILRVKTDFNATAPGQQLSHFEKPLEKVLPDERMRIKAAMAQAQESGLTIATVLATFDSLLAQLQNEAQTFAASVDHMVATEVTQKGTEIEQIKTQIEGLQKKLVQLTTEKSQSETKISNKKAEFDAALASRTTELQQEKAHYAGLLQG